MSDQVLITTSKLVSLADSVRSHASLSDLLKLPDMPGMIQKPNKKYGILTYDTDEVVLSFDDIIEHGLMGWGLTSAEGYENSYKLYASKYADWSDNFFISEAAAPYRNDELLYSHEIKMVIPGKAHGIAEIGNYSGYSLFNGSSLIRWFKQIVIDEGVYGIVNFINGTDEAYYWGPQEIILPNSLKSIGRHSFIGMGMYTDVGQAIADGVYNKNFNDTAYRRGWKAEHQESPYWGIVGPEYTITITIPDGVETIDQNAFQYSDGLTIHYSGSVTGAPWGATNTTVVP